jgi:hypothetical protein
MKKIKLLAIGFLFALGANAQAPEYMGSKQEFKDGGISSAVRGSMIGVIGDKLYCSAARSNGIGAVTEKRFEVYDVKTLKEVKRKVIFDGKKDKMVDESVYDVIGNNLVAFSYVPPAKGDKTSDYSYYMMKYDAATLEPSGDKTDLFDLKREKSKVYNYSTYETSNKSPNGKYLAFAVTNINTGDVNVALIDDKANILWTAEDKITLPADYTVSSLQVVLNNDGEVIVKLNVRNWDKGLFCSLHSFDVKGTKIASAKFEVKPQIIQNAMIAVTDAGDFVIGGISTKEYQNEDYAYTDGYFAANFSSDLKGLGDVSKGVIKDKTDKKGRGMMTVSLNAVYSNKDGDAVVVTEDYDYAQSSKGSRLYRRGDAMIFTLGEKNTTATIIPKRTGGNFCIGGVGAFSFYKGSVYIVCNESKENLNKGEGDKLEYGSCSGEGIIMLIKYNTDDNSVEKFELAAKNSKDHFTIDGPSVMQLDNVLLFHSLPSALAGSGPGGLGKVTFK